MSPPPPPVLWRPLGATLSMAIWTCLLQNTHIGPGRRVGVGARTEDPGTATRIRWTGRVVNVGAVADGDCLDYLSGKRPVGMYVASQDPTCCWPSPQLGTSGQTDRQGP